MVMLRGLPTLARRERCRARGSKRTMGIKVKRKEISFHGEKYAQCGAKCKSSIN